MVAVAILRRLWAQRLLAAVGILVALTVGLLMTYRVQLGVPPVLESRQYQIGIASAELLIDSPSSQVADVSGGQAGIDVTALTSRARLLANLMATSPLKDRIAVRAGIAPRSLRASVPSTVGPAEGPKPVDSDDDGSARANRLQVSPNEELPIITADAEASTPEQAARISSAAVEELVVYLKSVAANDQVPDARQLVVNPLGSARSAAVTRGPRRLFSAIVFFVVFGLWCAGILIVSGLARDWRSAAADEDTERADEAPRRPDPTPRTAPRTPAAPPHLRDVEDRPPLELPERPDRSRRRGRAA